MDSPTSERRQYSRVDFETDVAITQEDNAYSAQLVDISLNGVLITTPEEYAIRTDLPCTVTVSLADDVEIVMQVTLVHSSTKTLGFHCTSIDMDSMTYLRRLVEMNLPDAGASERVLNELLRHHRPD